MLQQIKTVEQLKTQYAQRQASPDKLPNMSDLWSEAVVSVEKDLDKPAHERASDQVFNAVLGGALFAAIIHSLSGIDFVGQWRLPQVCFSSL